MLVPIMPASVENVARQMAVCHRMSSAIFIAGIKSSTTIRLDAKNFRTPGFFIKQNRNGTVFVYEV